MAKVQFDVNRHLKIVEKIPFVHGLSMSQVQKVLQAGRLEMFSDGHVLCRDGENSTAMFILLSGTLIVRNGDTELAEVHPVDIVGEMGVVTNQPRCATIEVNKAATLIVVPKMQFDVLLKNDIEMASHIYKNLLDSLSQKLRANNEKFKKTRNGDNNHLMAATV